MGEDCSATRRPAGGPRLAAALQRGWYAAGINRRRMRQRGLDPSPSAARPPPPQVSLPCSDAHGGHPQIFAPCVKFDWSSENASCPGSQQLVLLSRAAPGFSGEAAMSSSRQLQVPAQAMPPALPTGGGVAVWSMCPH